MKNTFFVFLFLIVIFGCKEQTNEPVARTQYEQWKSFNMHNYEIEQMRVCFCVDGGAKANVIVRSDTVFEVRRISDSTIIPYPDSKLYLTIDSLFGIIRYGQHDSLVYSYNAQFGFPETLDVDPQLHPIDGGVIYITSNLRPLK